jgi:hypothetical protein
MCRSWSPSGRSRTWKTVWGTPGCFCKECARDEIKGDELTVSAKEQKKEENREALRAQRDAETDREGWQMKAEPVQGTFSLCA